MIDQPGKFFLGMQYDPDAKQRTDTPFMLSARDLLAGAACMGAAGVGKDGLGMCLLEEALLQNIPALIVDPTGNLSALAGLSSERTSDARAAHRGSAELAAWGMDESRAPRLADRAVFQIYTPGGGNGQPVNVWQSMNPPPPSSGLNWTRHTEALRTRIAQAVSALLTLAGIESNAGQGRDHILLTTLFESAWRAGLPFDIGLLNRMIQDPPVARIGAFDMDVFYPKAERAALALALSNLAASPSFDAWQTGAPLDVATLLKPLRDGYTGVGGSNPAGKTRANIFNLAHLTEAERRFFITVLFSELLMWMHTQTGTSVLRCLIYIDAVAGLQRPFPDDALTTASIRAVMLQGHTTGVGLLLAAQNPADVDYAGLAGLGMWFISRLRTSSDRLLALDGLKHAGNGLDTDDVKQLLSGLPPHVFLAIDAAGAPHIFQARPTLTLLVL